MTINKIEFNEDQIQFAVKCMSDWIRIREDNGFGYPTAADVDHSSLLRRLLSGKKALEIPPPKSYSYPNYALAEGEAVCLGDESIPNIGVSSLANDEYNVRIDQHADWKWIDKDNGILEHRTWGKFRTWVQDVERAQVELGSEGKRVIKVMIPSRMLQKI